MVSTMTQSAVAFTREKNSQQAATHLGRQLTEAFGGQPPDALILFASSSYDCPVLLRSLQEACRPIHLLGCSSAGEFTRGAQGESSACAMALRSSEMKFGAGLGRGLRSDRIRAAKELVSTFGDLKTPEYGFRYSLIFADALAAYTEAFIEQINTLTGGRYHFAGGGAGDDAQFQKTLVFYGTECVSDAAVALEIQSKKPLGIGVSHGWLPGSEPYRVTEAHGTRLVSLNATPAREVMEHHAQETGQIFDPSQPMAFFLHNIIGIKSGDQYKLRVPLAVDDKGALLLASDIPEGAIVHIMKTSAESASVAAARATEEAVRQLGQSKPKAALFFDCVATRLRMGKDFGLELESVERVLGGIDMAGFNSYGQIVRSPGQFSGFHNCTAVVCVIPE